MTPLISANQLEEIINSGENVLLCDCRFDLVDPLVGRKSYEESHIPGAIYVDLDKDLSGSKTGSNGRHPLPSPEAWETSRFYLLSDLEKDRTVSNFNFFYRHLKILSS